MTKHGIIAVVAAISPFTATRDRVRAMVTEAGGPNSFVEVYVKCPLEECMKRDPKGLYRKAREGAITGLTGYDAPYEEPKSPEITIDTQLIEVEPAAKLIVDYLTHLGVLGRLRS